MATKPLYRLSEGDHAIFDVAQDNLNIFTNWYIRGPGTGTWWRPEEKRDHLAAGYAKLYEAWEQVGRKDHFGEIGGRWVGLKPTEYEQRSENAEVVYRVVPQRGSERPAFHHRHGFMFFPWYDQVLRNKHSTRLIFGGFASGKSVQSLAEMLVYAAILPGFVGLCLAPYSLQAKDLYQKALSILTGTIYEKKFLMHKVKQPYAELTIGNDYVGENRIHFVSILDDAEKLKTLEADMALVDQTELFDDISATTEGAFPVVTSRLRGLDMRTGRERLTISTWVANATENPQLWELADRAVEDPEDYLFLQPSTFDNPMLTQRQLDGFVRKFGRTKEEADTYLYGLKPISAGEHFSQATLRLCHSEELDMLMDHGLTKGDEAYVKVEARGVGVFRWELPPEKDRVYLVAADPGWANPPARNSAAMVVLDVTEFPKKPAMFWGFHWVFGNNSPDPWIDAFLAFVERYGALGRCIYDGTGAQRGYARLTDKLNQVGAWPVDFGGQNKDTYLTILKLLMARGLIQYPRIPSLTHQLSKYVTPEPKGLAQDLVMMLSVAAAWLEVPYKTGLQLEEEDEEPLPFDPIVARLLPTQPTPSRYGGRPY